MTEVNEQTPVAEAQQPVAEPDVSAQLELVKAKNAELVGERRKDREKFKELQEQLSSLQNQQTQAKQKRLAEAGEYKPLWEEAQRTVADLQKQLAEKDKELEQERAGAQQQQIRAQAVNAMTQQGVFAPDQLYQLMSQHLRIKDGAVVTLHGGVEVDLGQHLQNLKNPGSGFEHFFRASGVSGMGSTPAMPSATSGMQNPYVTRNFTQMIALEASDPALAKRLQAEAGAQTS